MAQRIVADSGINWIFLYRVEYEDDCIIILTDLGRFHKLDEARTGEGEPITEWIEIIGDYIRTKGHPARLVEIR